MSKTSTTDLTALYLRQLQGKKERMRQSWKRGALWFFGLLTALIIFSSLLGEILPFFQKGWAFFSDFVLKKNWPSWIIAVGALLVPAVMVLILVLIVPIILVWWERKVAGHMQGRLGPMEVGGWHGWAQTIADGIKLFLKEIIEPSGVNRWVYRFAPIFTFLPAYLSFAPLPFGKGLVVLNLDMGLLFVMAVSGLSTIGILMGGWGSANKYSILGGLRAAAQVVSYEIPRVFAVVPVIMWAGTMNLTNIMTLQSPYVFGWFPRWFIFYPVIGQISFVIYFVTTIAETNRVPFDIPEAESELVAGFHTEYGGMKFAFFFLAEYAYVFAGSLLGVTLFLGGGAAPLPFLSFIPSWAWFLGKATLLIFVFLWARWTLPRLRVDRMMDLCWKFFLPWTFVNIGLSAAVFLWRQG